MLTLFAAVVAVSLIVQLTYATRLNTGFRRALGVESAIRAGANGSVGGRPSPTPATVVVAARNESKTIPTLVRALAEQDHAALEIIVVDDASTDATADIVTEFLPSARLIRVENPQHPRKKNALTRGIERATHDVLLFTDADCEPRPAWARSLSALHPDSNRVVVGYSPFRRRPGLLNGFARYETFLTGFAAAASIGLNRPYTAVGRNLSYRRSTFEAAAGFDHSRESMSGDDDLLIQHLATQNTVEIVHTFAAEAIVPSDPPETWSTFVRQKLRHASAGRWYRPFAKRHLAFYHATATLVWLSPVALGWPGAAAIVVRLVAQFMSMRTAARVFGERDLLPLQALYELMYAVYNVAIAPIGVLRKPRRW